MVGQGTLLERSISPPPARRARKVATHHSNVTQPVTTDTSQHSARGPSLAAIEAGQAVIDDHLAYFSSHFGATNRETIALDPSLPRLSIDAFEDLYRRNLHAHGHHFVVHQHDHPISGVHYDLRLQFSQTSTISFAIPYGLPGNANSCRPNRMAIETRVHNLWNNLIESASRATGSLLIWDTGEYEVLPYREAKKISTTDDELSNDDNHNAPVLLTQSERLFSAFQDKHIRLRLHGCRLPRGYTISLRLPSNTYQGRVKDPSRKRQKVRRRSAPTSREESTDSEMEAEVEDTAEAQLDEDAAYASEDDEDASIRANNAYTGATNTIGSMHQRHWFLSLDKKNSALTAPFFVMGRDVERSIVTGRTADDVLNDEGVSRFIGRKMWRPITE